MIDPEKKARVELTLMESGTLCHLLMFNFMQNGGTDKQPKWALELYRKLAHANDRLMGKRK